MLNKPSSDHMDSEKISSVKILGEKVLSQLNFNCIKKRYDYKGLFGSSQLDSHQIYHLPSCPDCTSLVSEKSGTFLP